MASFFLRATNTCVVTLRSLRRKSRLFIVMILVFGIFATNLEVPPASALSGLTLEVDYTPDSAVVATSALRGTQIDLTASTPVAIAGTTQQEIVQQVDPELDLRSASDITAPTGWTIYYSTDGATYTSIAPTTLAAWEALRYVKANGPLVSEGADANGRQIASTTATGSGPDSGQFSTANDSSGDGWDVIFDDMKHVYNIWHGRGAAGIDCHLRTGARCNGTWPYVLSSAGNYNANIAGSFKMSSSSNSTAWYDPVEKEIWIPTVYTRPISTVETSSVGFACLSVADIAAVTKWCGGSVAAGGFVSPGSSADFLTSSKCSDELYNCQQGLAESGGRIFTWATKTGDLVCVDIRLNSGAGGPCASGGVIDFGAGLPDANKSTNYAQLGVWNGQIYGNVNEGLSPGNAVCIVASTGATCPGWTNPRATLGGQGRYTTLPGLATGDPMRGACFIGTNGATVTRINCYDAAGTDIAEPITAEFRFAYGNNLGGGIFNNYNPTHDTRMYWGAGSASGTSPGIHCWDFALNNWCVNWTAAGIPDTNYQIALDPLKPTCIWSNAHDTIIQTYNAITGTAGNCAMPAPTINFDGGMQLPRMACSSQNSIQAWKSFTLVTAVTYTSATFSVKNSSGAAIAAWTNVTVPGNKIIDLATLPIADTGQAPIFSVTMTGRTDEGDVSAKISAIGGSPELCLRPTIACPSPIVHPSQLLAHTVDVIARASTTANSVISQFDPVTKAVNVAATPSSTCATSLSGNLRTGAGVAVAGVLVTLTDNSGTVLTHPADYPDASLRGTPITATSDASGNYSFPLVAPGAYKVKFVDASASVTVNQAIVTASGSGTTTDYTAATSLLSSAVTLVLGTPGVVDALYNSSHTLSKSFFPSSVNAGQVSVLTFTITNPQLSLKSGIGWVDSLPSGLVVDGNPNRRTTCAGGSSETLNPTAMTAVAGSTSITVTGASINAGVTSCTYSVNVKATANGVFTNGPNNVSTSTIDKDTNATLTALSAPVGTTLCDNNIYYLDSGQLYRQAFGSITRYAVGPDYTSNSVDAIGYNSVDNFLYGIAKSTTTSNGVALTAGHLVRISNTGILSDLGSLSGTGITDTLMATMTAGDFDNSGNLLVKATGSKTTLYSINVSTREATTITLSTAITGDDLAYAKGYFYSQSGMQVYKVAVSAGTNWTSSVLSIFPNVGTTRAAFSDGSGQIIFVEASGRDAYLLANPLTASSSSDVVEQYSYSSTPLDGAMCHAAPVPTASPDTSSDGKNIVQTKNLLANDAVATNATGVTLVANSVKLCDPNSTPAEVSPNCTKGAGSTISVANVGTYSVDALGVVTFTPVNNYLGTPPALNYQVSDSAGNIATSTYRPTVLDTLPTANHDTSSGPYNTNQVIDIVDNDTAGSLYPLNDASIKLCAVGTPDNTCLGTTLDVPNEGVYSSNPDGTVTFDPDPTFKGTATPIKYTILDTNGQLTTATITASVTAPNAPVATPESKSVTPGGTATFTTTTGTSGLATAAAGFNTSLTCLITPASNPAACDADGVVTIAGQGTYRLNTTTGVVTYEADAAATAGTKTAVTYQVTDITGQKATSTLTPIVPPAPTADNETSTGAYNTSQIIDVLTGDAAGAGATLNTTSVKLCATTATAKASCDRDTLEVSGQGTYTVNANGTVTFTPLSTFTGTASLVKYVVADSTTQRAEATIQPTVTAPATPVANPESKSVLPGGTATFTTTTGTSGLATAAAGFNTSLTCLITPASNPAECEADGVVEISGQGTYTLNTSTGVVTYVADAAVTAGTKTAITYQVTDITGQKATSTLTPIVPPPPTADNETSSGAYNTSQVIDVLTGDAAGTGATLIATSVKLCDTTSTAKASCNRDTLEVAGQGTYTVNANGTVTFVPLSTFTGTASPVKYVVADSTTQRAEATIQPTVAMPTPPTATPNAQAVIPGGTVSFTTITGTSGLASSVVGLTNSATCLITPASNPAACDADGVVTVSGVGTYTLNTTTGVVTLVADPAATQGTKAALYYQVTDTFGQTATSTLTPTIPAPPAASNDTSNGAYDTNQVISILTNDSATTPATLVVTSVKLCATTSTAIASCDRDTLEVAGQGTYRVNANGTVTFDPLPTFTGQASPVKYVVADSTTQLTGALITPTVAMPDLPTASPEAKSVKPGGTVAFTTITGASGLSSSVVGLNASATCLITPGSSPVECDADGVVEVAGVGTYTLNTTTGVVTLVADPAATQGTKAALYYQVTDTFGQKATSTLTPTIPPPPTADNETSNGAYDTNQVIDILTGDAAGAGAILDATSVKLCETISTAKASCNLDSLVVTGQGTYTVNSNGTVTFNPLPTFTGTASLVKYVVADSTTQRAEATIQPTVAMPAVPTVTPDTRTVAPGATTTFTTMTGSSGLASSPAGLNASVTCLITPGSSPAVCDADGVVTVVGVGTYTLNTTTGVVTLVADPAATQGTKAALYYQVTDIFGQTATSTLTPTIPPPPTADNETSSGTYDTNQIIDVLTGDAAGAGATLTTTSVKLCATISTANASCTLTELLVANEGTYRVNANGTVTFDPLPTFSGTASSVKYVVADSTTQLAAAFINVTVGLPALPVATPNTLSVAPGGTAAFTTLTGTSGLASSVAGLNTSVTCLITPASSPASCDADGIVNISGEGTFTLVNGVVSYTADANATSGTKTAITYQVTDIFGQTATSTLTPIIPAPPSATNDISSGAYDTNQTLTPVSNDQANSPATLAATSVKLCATTSTVNTSCNLTSLTVANQGTYTVNSNGTVTFNPLPTFAGQASPVKYVVADSTGQLANATMTPTVAAPPPPVATPDVKKVAPGTSVAFQPIFGAGALTSGSAELVRSSLCIVDPATNVCGTTPVVIEGEGVYTVDVDAGIITYKSIATAPVGERKAIAYKVTDVLGQTVTSTLTPIIPPAPTIVDDTSTGPWNTAQKLTPVANDTAGTGTTLVATSVKICAASSVGRQRCRGVFGYDSHRRW
jgi:CshA-type fibril repeat protein